MMKTLSLLPRNTAHPPLVGKTARTCTSITVLFTSERYPQENEKQATCIDRRIRFIRYVGTCESHEIFGPTRLHVRRAESLCVLRHFACTLWPNEKRMGRRCSDRHL